MKNRANNVETTTKVYENRFAQKDYNEPSRYEPGYFLFSFILPILTTRFVTLLLIAQSHRFVFNFLFHFFFSFFLFARSIFYVLAKCLLMGANFLVNYLLPAIIAPYSRAYSCVVYVCESVFFPRIVWCVVTMQKNTLSAVHFNYDYFIPAPLPLISSQVLQSKTQLAFALVLNAHLV